MKTVLTVLGNIRKKEPDLPVVMISTFDNPTYVARSIALGASDYLLKSASRDEIVDAIMRAARKEPPAETSLLKQVQGTMEKRKERGEFKEMPLTNRERQVLRHIALGLSNKEIGVSLGISVENRQGTRPKHPSQVERSGSDRSGRLGCEEWLDRLVTTLAGRHGRARIKTTVLGTRVVTRAKLA